MAACGGPVPSEQSLVLEAVESAFLSRLISTEKTAFDEDTVLRISRDVACAMQYVHRRGYIHCFLGSPSVVLTEEFTAKVGYVYIALIYHSLTI